MAYPNRTSAILTLYGLILSTFGFIQHIHKFEHISYPFMPNNLTCHVHVITSMKFHFHFTDVHQNYCAITLRRMHTLDSDPSEVSILNETYSIKRYRYIRIGSHYLVRKADLEGSDPLLQLDPTFTRQTCLLFVIVFPVDAEERIDEKKDPLVYFPYLTALSEIKRFYRIQNLNIEMEPADYLVIHVVTSHPSPHFNIYGGILRLNLHTLVYAKHPITIVLRFYSNMSNSVEVPNLIKNTTILLFCNYCEFYNEYSPNAAYDYSQKTNLYQLTTLETLSSNFATYGRPRLWTLPEEEYVENLNFEQYQNLENPVHSKSK